LTAISHSHQFFLSNSSTLPRSPHLYFSRSHTIRHTRTHTSGRTPLTEYSGRRRSCCLHSARLTTTIPTTERLQTLLGTITGIGYRNINPVYFLRVITAGKVPVKIIFILYLCKDSYKFHVFRLPNARCFHSVSPVQRVIYQHMPSSSVSYLHRVQFRFPH
jgi:hypothetical protein